MNERFCLATILHILQDEIEMFAMHPFPPTTQGTYHHLYEVNIKAIREISNHHFILFCVRRWTEANDVNLFIPWWRNFSSGKTIASKVRPTSHVFICYVESLNVVVCRIGLLFQFFGQASRSITRCCTFICKKSSRSHLHISHRTNLASSKAVTSN
jgi:hypothetical protein